MDPKVRMKILHVIYGVNPTGGGPIEGILAQARVWDKHGHHREIVSLDAADAPWVRTCPVKTYALGWRTPLHAILSRYVPRSWFYLLNYSPYLGPWLRANAEKYDAVIVNGLWNYTTFAVLRALKGKRVPYYVFTHGQLDPWFRRFYPFKHIAKQLAWLLSEGQMLKNARAVFFTTEQEKLPARSAFWPYQIREHVIGYGAADVTGDPAEQTAAFKEHLPKLQKKRLLLFLGRIHPKKGCDVLIRAFAQYMHRFPDVDLVIAGPDEIGMQRGLQTLARRLGADDRILWPGMLTGDAKWGAYRAAEAFVLPSHSENFGIAVAEALACGVPVLISDKVNICSVVEAKGAGLVSADNDADFSRILVEFLEKPREEKLCMARNARGAFLAHFDIEIVAMRLLDFMKHQSSTYAQEMGA